MCKRDGERESAAPCARKFARTPIWGGWNRPTFLSSLPHPPIFSLVSFRAPRKGGLAFNARRKVLKNWPRYPWVYTDWLIVCSEFCGVAAVGLNRRFYARAWIRTATRPAKSDVSRSVRKRPAKSLLRRYGAVKGPQHELRLGNFSAACLISSRVFERRRLSLSESAMRNKFLLRVNSSRNCRGVPYYYRSLRC